ncbi:hypothetical protein ACNKHU_05770 [Shigella flexneri]
MDRVFICPYAGSTGTLENYAVAIDAACCSSISTNKSPLDYVE